MSASGRWCGGVVAIAIGVTVAGCGNRPGGAATAAPPALASAPIVVTRDDRRLPRGCRPRAAARAVERFFADVTAERAAAAAGRFDLDSGREGWFSMSVGAADGHAAHFAAYDAATLERHLAERAGHGERLVLRELIVGHHARLGQLEIRFNRWADDLPGMGVRTSEATGKGAMDCTSGRLIVFSAGMPAGRPPKPMRLCPRADRDTPRGAIRACARRWR